MYEDKLRRIRAFIVDDEPVVRRGLELFFRVQPDLEVCGAAEGVSEALELIPKLKPDLAVVDLTLQDGDGIDLTRILRERFPALKILVFSMHDQPAFVEAAFRAGANGYISKDEGAENVTRAIRYLMDGKMYLTDVMAAKLPLSWRQLYCQALSQSKP